MQLLVALTFLSCLVLVISHPLNSLCDPDDEFKCGDGTCIPIERQCDNVPDCAKGEDEVDCHYLHNCDRGLFMCHSGECEPAESRCNGRRDCTDGSDEIGCPKKHEKPALLHSTPPTPRVLPIPVAPTPRVSTPVASTHRPLPIRAAPTIRPSFSFCEFRCDDGKCLPAERRCDNVRDCSSGEDELDCLYLHRCKADLFMCHSGECEPAEVRCNGRRECLDGSDEFGCPREHLIDHPAHVLDQPQQPLEVYSDQESDVWILILLISLLGILCFILMFLLCNRYPQLRYRRDLIVDRVASSLQKSPASKPLTPRSAVKMSKTSVVNPVFS